MRILSNPNANGAINSSYIRFLLASPLQFPAKPTFLYECMALTRINFAARKCHSHSNTVSISQSSSFCRAAKTKAMLDFHSKSFAALHDNPPARSSHTDFVGEPLRNLRHLFAIHLEPSGKTTNCFPSIALSSAYILRKKAASDNSYSPNHMAIIKYPSSHCRCCFLMYLPWSRTAFVKANYEANRPQKHRLHH